MTGPLLVFEDVTIRRGDRVVLDDVSFTIRAGEFVGLIGENGAGKSTILQLALGLLKPGAGRIRFLGLAPGAKPGAVGYVPQRLAFDPDLPLRARDFVALGVDGRRFGLPLPNRRRGAAVDEALAAVGATHLAERGIGRLSGGEQQRLAIAQAIACRPRLLVLDEPFAALDIANTAEIVALISRLSRDAGIAVLLVAHDVNPLLAAMDRVLYLAGGRAAIGTVAEVVNDDTLSRLYDRPVDVLRVRGRLVVVAGARAPDHG